MNEALMNLRRDGVLEYGIMADSLGFLLRLAQLRSFAEFFDAWGDAGIKPGEMTVLMMIAQNPGVRQGVLARALMIKRAHMTKMIRALEIAGMVARTVPEDDKRSVELWLSDACKAQMQEMEARVLAHETRDVARLTRAEARTLSRLLRKYVALDAVGKAEQ